jgi:hypothetical protein
MSKGTDIGEDLCIKEIHDGKRGNLKQVIKNDRSGSTTGKLIKKAH